MVLVLAFVAVLIAGTVIWFTVPYSPVKAEFARLIGLQLTKTTNPDGFFTPEDVAELPRPVQRYFQYCGYMGIPKMSNMGVYFNDVDFVLSPARPKLKIKYTQYNFVNEPARIAYIDTNLYGIPFEGIDAYQNGAGSMKGVIAKVYTLFNQKGEAMDRSSLVTCLAECLLYPNFALQDYIKWEDIDETHARAVITCYGTSASGVFTFNEDGALTGFTTQDREYTDTNGNSQKLEWSAVYEDYRPVDGIKFPSILKAVWHFETGDLVYFAGRDLVVEYDVAN